MKTITRDISTLESGIIIHQVNCMGVMGSGVAKALRDKHPQVFSSYKEFLEGMKGHEWDALGVWQEVKINDDLSVVNLFSQYDFGYDGKRYTEYGAFSSGLRCIADNLDNNTGGGRFYLPHRIACDRGGASWVLVNKIIERVMPNATFCKLPE